MSVNIRNPLTGQLTNASGGVINPKSINEMIAPIEDGTASKSYAVGEQFIMNDLLCEATQSIAQGDTMVIGTNCEESEQLSKQVKDINTSLTANGNRFEAGYSSANDEYGFNIGSTFYPIGASSGGGNSGLIPNFKDKLFTFDSTHKTYTATKTCFVLSSGGGITKNIHYSINGDVFVYAHSGQDSFINPIIPLQQGDVFTIDEWDGDTYSYVVVYGASIVSGDSEITVYNEAQLTFDYANPIFNFGSGTSFTATETCWLIGSISNGRSMKINNVGYSGTPSGGTAQVLLKLQVGDTVTITSTDSELNVVRGTISGSIGELNGEPIFDFANPLHTFTNNALTYTTTKECWLVGDFGLSALGNAELYINNTYVAHARYYNENCTCGIKYRLAPNTQIKITATANITQTLHVLDTI